MEHHGSAALSVLIAYSPESPNRYCKTQFFRVRVGATLPHRWTLVKLLLSFLTSDQECNYVTTRSFLARDGLPDPADIRDPMSLAIGYRDIQAD
jgi:hypothetical protein